MIDVSPFKNVQTGSKASARRGHLGSPARACLGVQGCGMKGGHAGRAFQMGLLHHPAAVNGREQPFLSYSQKPQLSANRTPKGFLNVFWKMKCHVSKDPKNSLWLFCKVKQQVLWYFRKYYRTFFLYPWTSVSLFLWRWVLQWTSVFVIGALQSSPSPKRSSRMGRRAELFACGGPPALWDSPPSDKASGNKAPCTPTKGLLHPEQNYRLGVNLFL